MKGEQVAVNSNDLLSGVSDESHNAVKPKQRISQNAKALRYTLKLLIVGGYVEPRKVRQALRIIAGTM